MWNKVEKLAMRFVLQESQSDLRNASDSYWKHRSNKITFGKHWAFALYSATRFPRWRKSSTESEIWGTARCQRDTTCVVAETRTEKVVHGICGYFAAVFHYALGCSERDGCGLRVASEFRSTDVRQFGSH